MYVLGDLVGIILVIFFLSFWVWILLIIYMWILIVLDLICEVKCMYSCDWIKVVSNGWMRFIFISFGVYFIFYYVRVMMIWKEWVVF